MVIVIFLNSITQNLKTICSVVQIEIEMNEIMSKNEIEVQILQCSIDYFECY